MPRINKVEACMFCGDLPCTCYSKTRKKPGRTVKTVKTILDDPTPKPSVREAMRQAVATQQTSPPVQKHEADDDNLPEDIIQALRVLNDAEVLHKDEKKRFFRYLTMSVSERAAAWKARRQ